MDIIMQAVLVGVGGTIVLDVYAFLLQHLFGVPATNWRMVGRWLGHMPHGNFIQIHLGQVEPVPGEHALGWVFHYVIGIGYGLLLIGIWGSEWLLQPGITEPLILALALLILPYCIMMPGMGMGIAGSQTPRPVITRLKSVAGHAIFGIGMYLSAQLLAAIA